MNTSMAGRQGGGTLGGTPGTVLLTLGRLPKGLDIARSFRAAGWRVLLAEPFDWNLCALSRAVATSFQVPAPNLDPQGYSATMAALVRREHVDLVVPISEETPHVSGLAEVLPDHVSIFAPAQDQLLPLHDKLHFAQALAQWGLPAPQSAEPGTDQANAIAQAGPYLIKDRLGASGSNIAFFDAGAPLPPPQAGTLVQERVLGREVSSFSIVHQGVVTALVVYEPVIRDGTVATVFERLDPRDPAARATQQTVTAIAEKTGHTGFLSFDLMINAAGKAVPFECNPRANSGIHFLETAEIAPAILDPSVRPRFRRQTRLQQAYPTLTLLWGAIGKWPRYRQIAKALFSARDVSWSWRDPLPFILMTPATWPLLRQSIFEGRSLGEAAIADIGWFAQSDALSAELGTTPGTNADAPDPEKP
ncbi:MAG: ATP-grasp domain-containing protein [Devosiaceae bacterium]|nr:ATP-grasp domain-containing protein [Devosiaceae bacterium MH13]